MKEKISQYLSSIVEDLSAEEFVTLLETPPEEEMGDLALPCFGLAKKMHKNPQLIAAEITEKLNAQKEVLDIEKSENAGAYCNIYWKREAYIKSCLEKLQMENLGVEQSGIGKTICMDYSSPNIAKNFHVGHLRTTIIGNALYKIYQKLGFDVVRINHLGDWGTQFGKLIVAYKLWSNEELVKKKGIEELLRIYVKFNSEAEHNERFITEAREWFVKMEQNDSEAIAIWEWFKQISMVEFERVYALLGITFDSYVGESFYRFVIIVTEFKSALKTVFFGNTRFKHKKSVKSCTESNIWSSFKYFVTVHYVAYSQSISIFITMNGIVSDNEYVAFINYIFFVIYNMNSASVYYDHKLVEILVGMNIQILFMFTVLY
ncbi:MAG: arginine--tRNA ligase, partial [Lachnospiraceae bacterium]|nr:arginine--tRNA ligase [Lachnospiraceae bacterium]